MPNHCTYIFQKKIINTTKALDPFKEQHKIEYDPTHAGNWLSLHA